MKTTAVLIFADAAKKASLRKKLIKDPQQNLALFEKLNRDIISTVKKTGITWFTFDDTAPEDGPCGEYTANAITSVYALGYHSVILVWNNCPGLDELAILKAEHQLQYTPLVVGPAHWGGIYMMGISKDIFSKVTFSGLSWQSNLLAHDLCCYHHGSIILPQLRVLNGPYSIRLMAVNRFFDSVAQRFPVLFVFNRLWHKAKTLFSKRQLPDARKVVA